MQFELNPVEGYRHGIVLESANDEVETMAAVYREAIAIKVLELRVDEIQKHERDFSMWANLPDRTIFVNYPLQIAAKLEAFHDRTSKVLQEIAIAEAEPAFESDSIARRMYLGEKALQMAGFVRVEYDNENLQHELDELVTDVLADAESPPGSRQD